MNDLNIFRTVALIQPNQTVKQNSRSWHFAQRIPSSLVVYCPAEESSKKDKHPPELVVPEDYNLVGGLTSERRRTPILLERSARRRQFGRGPEDTDSVGRQRTVQDRSSSIRSHGFGGRRNRKGSQRIILLHTKEIVANMASSSALYAGNPGNLEILGLIWPKLASGAIRKCTHTSMLVGFVV